MNLFSSVAQYASNFYEPLQTYQQSETLESDDVEIDILSQPVILSECHNDDKIIHSITNNSLSEEKWPKQTVGELMLQEIIVSTLRVPLNLSTFLESITLTNIDIG